jgi:hypothetical protein
MGLAENYRQIFGFKGLIFKILWNKDLEPIWLDRLSGRPGLLGGTRGKQLSGNTGVPK